MAAMGTEDQETDAEYIRAFVGATYIAEATHDVRQIRRLLTLKD